MSIPENLVVTAPKEKKGSESSARSVVVDARGVSAGYEGKRVLRSVTITARESEIVSILGHNGSGKSTLLKVLIGVISSDEGQVSYFGRRVANLRPSTLLQLGVVYHPQGTGIFRAMTVLENLELRAWSFRFKKTALRAELARVFSLMPEIALLQKRVSGSLSGGEQRVLGLAVALIGTPRVLLLDEPALGLDAKNAELIFARIRATAGAGASTVLLVEQRASGAVAISDRTYFLEGGRVTSETPSEQLRTPAALRALFRASTLS